MSASIQCSDFIPSATYYLYVRNMAGLYWTGSAFEAYDATHWTSYAKSLAAANAAGDWLGAFPACPAGLYTYQIRRRAGGTPATSDENASEIEEMNWSGTDAIIGGELAISPDDITDISQGVFDLLAATPTILVFPETAQNSDSFSATSHTYNARTFIRTDVLLTGWTSVVFTLKRSTDDVDDDALISVVKSNPSDTATDGLKIFNGRGVDVDSDLRSAGDIVVTVGVGSSTIAVKLYPDAMALNPSESGSDYSYAVDWFDAAGVKRNYVSGKVALSRAVRRTVTA